MTTPNFYLPLPENGNLWPVACYHPALAPGEGIGIDCLAAILIFSGAVRRHDLILTAKNAN